MVSPQCGREHAHPNAIFEKIPFHIDHTLRVSLPYDEVNEMSADFFPQPSVNPAAPPSAGTAILTHTTVMLLEEMSLFGRLNTGNHYLLQEVGQLEVENEKLAA